MLEFFGNFLSYVIGGGDEETDHAMLHVYHEQFKVKTNKCVLLRRRKGVKWDDFNLLSVSEKQPKTVRGTFQNNFRSFVS